MIKTVSAGLKALTRRPPRPPQSVKLHRSAQAQKAEEL